MASKILDTYYTYSFVRLLTQKWEQTEAFKAGVLDKDGNLLVPVEKQTPTQKDTYTMWHRLVFNVKRLLQKLPFGRTRLGTYAAALWLIKEHVEHKADFDALLGELFSLYPEDETDVEDMNKFAESLSIRPGLYVYCNKHNPQVTDQSLIMIWESLKPIGRISDIHVYKDGTRVFAKEELLPINEQIFEDGFLFEDVTTTGAAAGLTGEPPGPKIARKDKKKLVVFNTDDKTYSNYKQKKNKYWKDDSYLSDTPVGRAIRTYKLSNNKPVALRNEETGQMFYLREPNNVRRW